MESVDFIWNQLIRIKLSSWLISTLNYHKITFMKSEPIHWKNWFFINSIILYDKFLSIDSFFIDLIFSQDTQRSRTSKRLNTKKLDKDDEQVDSIQLCRSVSSKLNKDSQELERGFTNEINDNGTPSQKGVQRSNFKQTLSNELKK